MRTSAEFFELIEQLDRRAKLVARLASAEAEVVAQEENQRLLESIDSTSHAALVLRISILKDKVNDTKRELERLRAGSVIEDLVQVVKQDQLGET